MRSLRNCKAITITELLTVVALLTILTSFLSPFVVSVKHAALGRLCAHNLRQCYVGAQMYANQDFGRMPSALQFATSDNPLKPGTTYSINENRWWYNKIAEKIYVAKNPSNNPVAGGTLPGDQCVLRCPGSTDPYDQERVRMTGLSYWRVSGTGSAKDRVFDDNFGYNNFGFRYYDSSGASRETACALPNPGTLDFGVRPVSFYYREAKPPNPFAAGASIRGRVHVLNDTTGKCDCGATWPCAYATVYCRLGDFAQVPEAARTLMMMDYVKADVAPNLRNDGVWGYRFRHDGRANAMFVDGHVETYTRNAFLRDWMEPDHAKWGTAEASDPLTQRGRIHWAVLRP